MTRSLLLQHNAEEQLIIVVPTESVLLLETAIPKTTRKKLIKALPYLVEEQLTQDIADYHLALAATQTDKTKLNLAVVTHHTMQAWLKEVSTTSSEKPFAMIPDCLLLPWEPGTWSILIDQNTAIVRTGLSAGFACDLENLTFLIHHTAADKKAPTNLHIFNPQQKNLNSFLPQEESLLITTNTTLTLNTIFKDALSLKPTINLLQQTYAQTHYKISTPRLWQWVLLLLFISIGLSIASKAFVWLSLEYREMRLNHQINEDYHRYFHTNPPPENAAFSLQQKLTALSQQIPGNTFLSLLGPIAKNASTFQDITIVNIQFNNAQLQLSVEAPNATRLQAFVEALGNDSLQANVLPTPFQQNKLISTIIISENNP